MRSDYLIVSKAILPPFYEKVVQARSLLETKKVKSVQEAVRSVGISRSTYYKYKDYIFRPSQDFGRRFTFSMVLLDEPGVLSQILKTVSGASASIVTIHQDVPINHCAVVTLTLDGSHMEATIEDLKEEMLTLDGVNSLELIAME